MGGREAAGAGPTTFGAWRCVAWGCAAILLGVTGPVLGVPLGVGGLLLIIALPAPSVLTPMGIDFDGASVALDRPTHILWPRQDRALVVTHAGGAKRRIEIAGEPDGGRPVNAYRTGPDGLRLLDEFAVQDVDLRSGRASWRSRSSGSDLEVAGQFLGTFRRAPHSYTGHYVVPTHYRFFPAPAEAERPIRRRLGG